MAPRDKMRLTPDPRPPERRTAASGTRKALDEVMVATSWQKPKEAPMVDAAYSRKLQLGPAVLRARWQLIIPLVAALS